MDQCGPACRFKTEGGLVERIECDGIHLIDWAVEVWVRKIGAETHNYKVIAVWTQD